MELERRGRRRNNEKKQNMFESATPKSFVCDSFSGEPRGVQAALQLHPEAGRLQPLSFQHSLARPGRCVQFMDFASCVAPGVPAVSFSCCLSFLAHRQKQKKRGREEMPKAHGMCILHVQVRQHEPGFAPPWRSSHTGRSRQHRSEPPKGNTRQEKA